MKQEISYKIAGLDCAEEVKVLKKVFANREGIDDLFFDVLNGKMTVNYNREVISTKMIERLIASTGMQSYLWEERLLQESGSFWSSKGPLIMVYCSGIFLVIALILEFLVFPDFQDLLLGNRKKTGFLFLSLPYRILIFYLFAIITGAWFVFPKMIKAISHFRADMNLLMTIAVIGAMIIGEWFEAATVSFLFAVALQLEHWSMAHARKAISSLMDLSPTTARIQDSETGKFIIKRVEHIEKSTTIFIHPGEKIPLDAMVIKGSSNVNQAPITGESIPVEKNPNDTVYAGTINDDGALECLVIKDSKDTTLAGIINLIEKSQSKRAATQRWVEKFAQIYTPIMVILAFFIIVIPPLLFDASWIDWFSRGLVILVIACPCALVISTPVSIVSALTASAKHGILIKGGMALELPATLQVLAFDKTGTITQGQPGVQKIISLGDYTEAEILKIAASIELSSEHPLAGAIIKHSKEKKIEIKPCSDFKNFKGLGAEGVVDNQLFWIGSHRFMHQRFKEPINIHDIATKLEETGCSVVALGNDTNVLGLISISDAPKKLITEILISMKATGIKHLVMLTGDNIPTAKALAEEIQIDQFYAELLPVDKLNIIEELKAKWGPVAMIGDGVNDAPAMAASNCGIAMGTMGTDVAIETADIALMSDDLSKIPWLIRHSKNTLKIIKQNIYFALGLKFLFMILALFGLSTLWMAIGADMGASLLVVFNGLRLLKR